MSENKDKVYWFNDSILSDNKIEISYESYGYYQVKEDGSIFNTKNNQYVGNVNDYVNIGSLEKILKALGEIK